MDDPAPVLDGAAAVLDGAAATWMDAAARIRDGCVAILPFGAYEQHGPHLPLSTDTIMAAALARGIAARVPSILLPPLHYGETWNNEAFPGTVSLSFDTVRAIALDVCASVRRDGIPGLVVVNGDFGNQAPLRQAAREARQRWDYPVLVVDYPGLAEVAAAVCETEPAGPGFYHADEVETSIVLAVEPGWVQMGRADAEYPDFPPVFASTPVPLRELSASGVFGDPRPATAAKGGELLDGLTERAMAVVEPFVAAVLPAR